jgi:hypothetical protein
MCVGGEERLFSLPCLRRVLSAGCGIWLDPRRLCRLLWSARGGLTTTPVVAKLSTAVGHGWTHLSDGRTSARRRCQRLLHPSASRSTCKEALSIYTTNRTRLRIAAVNNKGTTRVSV